MGAAGKAGKVDSVPGYWWVFSSVLEGSIGDLNWISSPRFQRKERTRGASHRFTGVEPNVRNSKIRGPRKESPSQPIIMYISKR